MLFKDFALSASILRALQEKGYAVPTPIQQKAIPEIIGGKDLVGCAQTGTGKTAAFCIPILHRLETAGARGRVRVLMLAPTRELAIQIAENLTAYGKHLPFRHALIYGGVSQHHQVQQLRRGVDIVVATPGRLKDLMDQRLLSLKDIEILVLDEADRMLDMGFIRDIKRIMALIPAGAQKILFSATMPREIQLLVNTMLKNPQYVKIEPQPESRGQIDESVYFVDRTNKRALLKHLIVDHNMHQVLVFTRTKYGADKIAKDLKKSGIEAEAIHGDKSQNARVRALSNFKERSTRVLVATDIAARGIDISNLSHVINFELPETTDTYTHRIGRTGRAGASGKALSLCDGDEKGYLSNINRVSSRAMKVMAHPYQ